MDLHMDPAAVKQHTETQAEGGSSQYEHQCLQHHQPGQAEDGAVSQQQQQLTPTVQSGLEAIASRKQDIHAKVIAYEVPAHPYFSAAALQPMYHLITQSPCTAASSCVTVCLHQVMLLAINPFRSVC